MRISDVLRHKGADVATITASATVRELVAQLAERRVGALVVSEDGRHVAGIVSERDVARRLHDLGPDLLDAKVETIMTREVHHSSPSDSVEDMMALMTNRRVRHVPVLVDGELAGLVSIGDLVKHRIDELESERDQLTDYISGDTGPVSTAARSGEDSSVPTPRDAGSA